MFYCPTMSTLQLNIQTKYHRGYKTMSSFFPFFFQRLNEEALLFECFEINRAEHVFVFWMFELFDNHVDFSVGQFCWQLSSFIFSLSQLTTWTWERVSWWCHSEWRPCQSTAETHASFSTYTIQCRYRMWLTLDKIKIIN